jgi:hypothetical protein
MWACLSRLKEGLHLLRHYIDGLDKEDCLLGLRWETCGVAGPLIKDFHEHFRSKNNKALYNYNTIIISLYGYLERFIEDLIAEHLEQLSSVVKTFTELPGPIQANHLTLSLELSRRIDYQRNVYAVRPEDIIAKLHACYATPDEYQLNLQAFTQHNANFRQTIVNDTFSKCGIMQVGQCLRRSEQFLTYLKNEDSERDVALYLAAEDDIVFFRLNDLANRRNDVAHGTPVDEILSRDILRTYVDFIEAYAEGLALVVYEQTLPYMIKRAFLLGPPIRVIDNRIVCIELPSGEISLGDTLIAKTQDPSRPFKGGFIEEIQQNHTPVDTIKGGPGVQIGVRVEFGAKDNHEYYYLNAPRQ